MTKLLANGVVGARTWWHRRRVVRQYDHADCGPAALLTVLRWWGGEATLPWIRALTKTDSRGTSLLELAEAAEALGFSAYGAVGEYDDLHTIQLPCIAHFQLEGGFSHFVVVYRVQATRTELGDPAAGRLWMPREEFLTKWRSRAVLVLNPGPSPHRSVGGDWWRWLTSQLRDDGAFLVQAVFLGVIYAVLGFAVALCMQLLIDRFLPRDDRTMVVATMLALLVLYTFRAGAAFIRQRLLTELQWRLGRRVVGNFAERVFHLPLAFFESRRTGDLTSRLADLTKVQAAVLRVVGTVVIDGLIVLGTLLSLAFLATPLAWLALVLIPAYAIVVLSAARGLKYQQGLVAAAYSNLESTYIESLSAISEILGFGAGESFANAQRASAEQHQQEMRVLGKLQASVGWRAEMLGGAILVAGLAVVAWLTVLGRMQVGSMVASYSLLAGMIPSILRLIEANVALQGGAIAASRLMDVFSADPEASAGNRPFALQASLSLRDASFAWPRGQLVLQATSVHFYRGELSGLCGESGSGKSTLVKILERKYPLDSGRLLLDQIPAETVSLAEYRAHIAVVPEAPTIFDGSLYDNIILGESAISPAAVEQRLTEFDVLRFFARFEGGLATRVGQNGRQLSTGERQLIGFARAFVRNPDILIVDEGLSGIDPAMSDQLLRALRDLSRDRVVLIISHDAITLEHVDRCYRMSKTGIAETRPALRPGLAAGQPVHARLAGGH